MQLWKASLLLGYLLAMTAFSMYVVARLWAAEPIAQQAAGDPHLFGRESPVSQELRLLLLVLVTGALGSSVYALKSLADYIGECKLQESWFTFYLVQPWEGAGIAFIFYVVLRGGFFAGVNSDFKTVNAYGLSAMAALVGIFSDIAFGKLREVFEIMFKPTDTRSGGIRPR